MLKISAIAGALTIGLVSGAYAQIAGPAAQTDKPGMTNSNSDAAKKSGTTSMSNTQNKETGWSGLGDKGPYDGPNPKATAGPTTGPTGSDSKPDPSPK